MKVIGKKEIIAASKLTDFESSGKAKIPMAFPTHLFSFRLTSLEECSFLFNYGKFISRE